MKDCFDTTLGTSINKCQVLHRSQDDFGLFSFRLKDGSSKLSRKPKGLNNKCLSIDE